MDPDYFQDVGRSSSKEQESSLSDCHSRTQGLPSTWKAEWASANWRRSTRYTHLQLAGHSYIQSDCSGMSTWQNIELFGRYVATSIPALTLDKLIRMCRVSSQAAMSKVRDPRFRFMNIDRPAMLRPDGVSFFLNSVMRLLRTREAYPYSSPLLPTFVCYSTSWSTAYILPSALELLRAGRIFCIVMFNWKS